MASPFITSCVLVPALLAESGVAGQEILGLIGAGEAIVAAGLIEPEAGYDFNSVALRAEKSASGYTLSGSKVHVEDGGDADWFVVSARTGEPTEASGGGSLFLVPRHASGLKVETYRAIDHHRHAKLALNGVTEALLVSPLGGALPIIETAVDHAICAHLAEAVGSMDAVTEATLEFVRTRKQFGAAIGSFQVIQHRMVDMTLACEEARSILYEATLSLHLPRLERRRIVSAAKTRVCQNGLYVGRDAVQLHGGVGVCEDLIVSHHLRRQMMLEFAHGTSDLHTGKFVAANTALLKAG